LWAEENKANPAAPTPSHELKRVAGWRM
jgi:hypothetical protein